MSKLRENYTVLLRSDIPTLEKELIEQMSFKIVSDKGTGEYLPMFRCTEVSTTHHYLISMETFKSDDDEFTMSVQLPLHYVVMISGSKDHPSMGFLHS